MDTFSIMPIEAFMDDRLTKTDLRVLGAILSWRDKTTNLCWPKRKQIADRCRLPLCKISTSTTRLVTLGWLKKEGDGGRCRSAKYELIIPILECKTVTDSVTVTKSETVTDSVTETLTDLVTKTVTDSVRGIKQTNEQTNEQTNKRICRFDEFWNEYTKKVAKKDCLKKWRSKQLDLKIELLVADIKKRKAEDSNWHKGFIPNPLTYINGERWEDEITVSKSFNNNPQSITRKPSQSFKECQSDYLEADYQRLPA